MPKQKPVQLAHWRIDTEGRHAKDFRPHLSHGRRNAIGVGGQVMWDRANLAPTLQTSIGFQAQDVAFDRRAGFAFGHMIGFVTGQVDGPKRYLGDPHW